MKLCFCVICGTNKNLQHHHIVPRSLGGDDHQHNILTLCNDHHNWIHNIRKTRSKGGFVAAIKAGQKNGVGGRPKLDKEKVDEVVYYWYQGLSYRQIQKKTGVALSTIGKIKMREELPNRPNSKVSFG
jgi:hypothetical protein